MMMIIINIIIYNIVTVTINITAAAAAAAVIIIIVDSFVGTVARLRNERRRNFGSIPGRDERFFFASKCADRFSGPPRFIFNVWREF
jgi:hypothetical protein